MLISEYLQLRNNISVTTGNVSPGSFRDNTPKVNENGATFAEELERANQLAASKVQFSKHAIERLDNRDIDITEGDMLGRLNRAVELAESKGSNDALVIVDSAAFLVSVKNNKVITAMNTGEMTGSCFTNIDSTVIM
ncbi:MAG: hypothetical protein MSH60_09770 [Ruminococcus sp.]|nr:hypothetical protein [Ruminococcus sp.]